MSNKGQQQHTEARQHLHYVHTLQYSLQERLVGLFILGALILLLAGLIFSQQSAYLFEDTFTIHSSLQNAEGISRNTPVNASGVQIGRVLDIELDELNTIQIRMQIRERYHSLVRFDSMAELNNLSMFGTTAINISGGQQSSPEIPHGGHIRMVEKLSLNELMGDFIPVVESLADSLQQIAAMNEGEHSLVQLVEDISVMTGNLRKTSQQLTQTDNVMGRLLNDKTIPDQFDASLEHVQNTLATAQDRLQEVQPLLSQFATVNQLLEENLRQFSETQISGQQLILRLDAELASVPGIAMETEHLIQESQQTLDTMHTMWPFAGAIGSERQSIRQRYDEQTLTPLD